MNFSQSELKKVAHLARLSVSGLELEKLTSDLSNILTMIEDMSQVNTDAIEPMAHPLNATARLREDEVTEPNQRDAFQAIAPETMAGLYLVPKVLEEIGPEDL